jgi:hypothetical protein
VEIAYTIPETLPESLTRLVSVPMIKGGTIPNRVIGAPNKINAEKNDAVLIEYPLTELIMPEAMTVKSPKIIETVNINFNRVFSPAYFADIFPPKKYPAANAIRVTPIIEDQT